MRKLLASLSLIPLVGCWALVGCATLGRGCATSTGDDLADKARKAANHAADLSLGLGYLGVIAFACIAAGIIIIVASFIPVVSDFVPRKAAAVAILCGIAVHLLRAFLDKFQEAILWGAFGLVVVAGACLLWPIIVAAHRGTLWAEAKKLIAKGHIEAAAAMQIMAVPKKFAGAADRKALVASLIKKVPANVPVVVGVPSPAVGA